MDVTGAFTIETTGWIQKDTGAFCVFSFSPLKIIRCYFIIQQDGHPKYLAKATKSKENSHQAGAEGGC